MHHHDTGQHWQLPRHSSARCLSRHVTVRHADVGHYTSNDALIAILLVASMLGAFQEFPDEQDARAHP